MKKIVLLFVFVLAFSAVAQQPDIPSCLVEQATPLTLAVPSWTGTLPNALTQTWVESVSFLVCPLFADGTIDWSGIESGLANDFPPAPYEPYRYVYGNTLYPVAGRWHALMTVSKALGSAEAPCMSQPFIFYVEPRPSCPPQCRKPKPEPPQVAPQVTITFNGPIASDIPVRGRNVVLYDFAIGSSTKVEVGNLRFRAITSNIGPGEGFNNLKVQDAASDAAVTSPVDVGGTGDVTFADAITINAGQSRRFKVTADVDADDDMNDAIQVALLAFKPGDILDLDAKKFVPPNAIIPDSTIIGNVMTVKVPTLDMYLAAKPGSGGYFQGATNVPLVGIGFRAISDDIRLDAVKVTARALSGVLEIKEVTNLALYDGATKISSLKNLSDPFSVLFLDLNFAIAKGESKNLTVRGDIASDATVGDVYSFSASPADVTAYDRQGNTALLSGSTVNASGSVTVTVVGHIRIP